MFFSLSLISFGVLYQQLQPERLRCIDSTIWDVIVTISKVLENAGLNKDQVFLTDFFLLLQTDAHCGFARGGRRTSCSSNFFSQRIYLWVEYAKDVCSMGYTFRKNPQSQEITPRLLPTRISTANHLCATQMSAGCLFSCPFICLHVSLGPCASLERTTHPYVGALFWFFC